MNANERNAFFEGYNTGKSTSRFIYVEFFTEMRRQGIDDTTAVDLFLTMAMQVGEKASQIDPQAAGAPKMPKPDTQASGQLSDGERRFTSEQVSSGECPFCGAMPYDQFTDPAVFKAALEYMLDAINSFDPGDQHSMHVTLVRRANASLTTDDD